MKYLIFNHSEVQALLNHSINSPEHSPNLEQLFDPAYRHDGKEPDEGVWPKSDEVDSSKIPYGLWLVADQGVYLMSNGNPGFLIQKSPIRHQVCYAMGINPDVNEFDDWWNAKRYYMGGDDQSLFIDGAKLSGRLEHSDDRILIGVKTDGMCVTHTDI